LAAFLHNWLARATKHST